MRDLLLADEFGGEEGHPHDAVGAEQRREPVVVVHHQLSAIACKRGTAAAFTAV
jgi:hypothetical protein